MNNIYNITKQHGSAIFINTTNIKKNYLFLQQLVAPSKVAAVLKSNAYGTGLKEISTILNSAGCQDFFVATASEALIIRQTSKTANIYVLHGIFENNEHIFIENNLIPVLNSLLQIQKWQNYAKKISQKLPAIIHIDTGINRLGLKKEELEILDNVAIISKYLNIVYVMSHLACSSDSNNLFNLSQLNAFTSTTDTYFKGIKRSFTSSYGLFFGKEYYFDLIRPGFALYGSNPTPGKINPLSPVIEFYSTILKINKITKGEAIGYNHLWSPNKEDSMVATVSVGYSDGIFLNHKEDCHLFINNEKVPIVGRVSMDSLMVDISNLKTPAKEGDIVEIIGKNQDIDAFATLNNTINCEALNILSLRYPRIYY